MLHDLFMSNESHLQYLKAKRTEHTNNYNIFKKNIIKSHNVVESYILVDVFNEVLIYYATDSTPTRRTQQKIQSRIMMRNPCRKQRQREDGTFLHSSAKSNQNKSNLFLTKLTWKPVREDEIFFTFTVRERKEIKRSFHRLREEGKQGFCGVSAPYREWFFRF